MIYSATELSNHCLSCSLTFTSSSLRLILFGFPPHRLFYANQWLSLMQNRKWRTENFTGNLDFHSAFCALPAQLSPLTIVSLKMGFLFCDFYLRIAHSPGNLTFYVSLIAKFLADSYLRAESSNTEMAAPNLPVFPRNVSWAHQPPAHPPQWTCGIPPEPAVPVLLQQEAHWTLPDPSSRNLGSLYFSLCHFLVLINPSSINSVSTVVKSLPTSLYFHFLALLSSGFGLWPDPQKSFEVLSHTYFKDFLLLS